MENRMALHRIARPRSRSRLDVLLLLTLMIVLLVLFGFSDSTCQATAMRVTDGHASLGCQAPRARAADDARSRRRQVSNR